MVGILLDGSPMGRIDKSFPGADGLVRVAHIKTSSAEFQSLIVKLDKFIENPEAVSVHAVFFFNGRLDHGDRFPSRG